jgi:signal peptidase II
MRFSASTASAAKNASAKPAATATSGTPDEQMSRPSPLRIYLPLLLTAALVVAADQATKQLVLDCLQDGSVEVIEGVLRFRLTYNSGGAFGLLQSVPGLFLIATVVIVLAILFGARRLEDVRWAVPLGLVLGGGIGNATDRVLRDTGGGVIDFIDFRVWPVFNIADMAIVTGALVILFIGWRSPGDEETA